MLKTFFKYFVELTGNPFASSLLKTFSNSRLSRPLIRPYSKIYKINEDEMEHMITNYKSLHDFFTRRLREDARVIDDSPHSLISPVDGIVSEMGEVASNKSFLIKSKQYDLEKILGDQFKAAPYANGYFFILYLSPSHYHRIHYPIKGKLTARYALGKKSYPVNDLGIRFGNKPFATNYRLISELSTEYGKIAIVKVGALNINSVQVLHSNLDCKKGEELGYFSFGSTVILFLEKSRFSFKPTIRKNSEVKMGQSIGTWLRE